MHTVYPFIICTYVYIISLIIMTPVGGAPKTYSNRHVCMCFINFLMSTKNYISTENCYASRKQYSLAANLTIYLLFTGIFQSYTGVNNECYKLSTENCYARTVQYSLATDLTRFLFTGIFESYTGVNCSLP